MSRDIVMVVVPFAQVQHEHDSLQDFWRFTPTCVRQMYRENELTVVYEAVNDDRNAGVYVFAVGSKQPDLWAQKLPGHQAVRDAAWGVGASWKERLKRLVSKPQSKSAASRP
jgi:hypothetical protein